jgi:hypothetical protein
MRRGPAAGNCSTRRELLRRGVSLAAAGLTADLLAPGLARATWPSGRLGGAAALRVAPHQFMPLWQLNEWQAILDQRGLRATASPAHNAYIDSLAQRLEQVGVQGIYTEAVPFTGWFPSTWSLEVVSGPHAGSIPVAAYIPYTGQTGPNGITGPLVPAAIGGTSQAPTVSVTPVGLPKAAPPGGQIVLFDALPRPLVNGVWDGLDWGAPSEPHHAPGYSQAGHYDRAWIAQPTTPLDELGALGYGGAIGILDLPADAAQGMYMPYDAKLRNLPSLFVDRDTGTRLREVGQAGGTVRLTLDAVVKSATSPNLIGLIPGASDELVMLECHTDGTNGVEDNGPEAILAMCQYLARLPRAALKRSILVVLSTGHFAAGDLGASAFVARHMDDLIARTAAALTIEHLGAMEWLAGYGPGGGFGLTGKYELGGAFASPFPAYIDRMRAALSAARVTEDRVMRPWVPVPYTNPTDPLHSGGQPGGVSPDGVTWPGDGESFWARGGLPAANFITGPSYLLNGGKPVADLIDIRALRRQAIAFTNLVLELTRVPLSELKQRELG